MVENKSKKEVLDTIINGYRELIFQRYQYDALKSRYDIPLSFGPEKIEEFRDYFLNQIYPPPHKRDELNEAFDSLDNYIKNPEKLLRLLLDSTSLLVKYGRHLPKILKAGMKALGSFRTATVFEKKLVQKAIDLRMAAPFDSHQIKKLIHSLSKVEINQFIKDSEQLFNTIHDRTLVKKLKEIIGDLIDKMEKRPKTYSTVEVNGFKTGREMISKADELFDKLSNEDQSQLIKVVIQIERDFLEDIFNDSSLDV